MSLSFKELVRKDADHCFLNELEFADLHRIDAREMRIIIDDIEALDRQVKVGQNMAGMYVKQKLIYVRREDFGPLPAIGRGVNLDGKAYRVSDAVEEDGILSITLEANKS